VAKIEAMKQISLGLNLSTKKTRKREFLEEMERVVPWKVLVQIVEPYWPKSKTGRPPFAIEAMLRVHYMQQWFGLSDPAMEEALVGVNYPGRPTTTILAGARRGSFGCR
jgi:IS5 family transposase